MHNFIDTLVKTMTKPMTFYSDELFTYLDIAEDTPRQGWKIHVSATEKNYYFILFKCIKYCVDNAIDMKFIKNYELLVKNLSKVTPRANSGKFITIYPENEANFIKVCKELYVELREYEGPYIFSDKRYKDCRILYYRYGRCLVDKEETETERRLLVAPNGNLVEDKRLPYYIQPSFVKDPFEEKMVDTNNMGELLNNRYKIFKAIHYSNTGGIYIAKDMHTSLNVIIKEARPYIDSSGFGDCINMRKRELEFFKIFTDFCPKVIDHFFEWEHFFSVVEYIEGQTISQYSNDVVKEVYLRRNNQFLDDVTKTIVHIIEMIRKIHSFGVTIGDISDNNIIKNSKGIYLVDFEFGLYEFENPDFFVKTLGFDSGFEEKNTQIKDLRSLGLLIVSLFIGTNKLANLDINAVLKTFYYFSQENNLNSDIYCLIYDLLITPESVDLKLYEFILTKNYHELSLYEFKRIKKILNKENETTSSMNSLIEIGTLSYNLEKINLQNEEFLLLYFLTLSKHTRVKFYSKKNIFRKFINNIDEKTSLYHLSKVLLLLLVMIPKIYLGVYKNDITKIYSKIINYQNKNGNFMYGKYGTENQGIIEGDTLIILVLVEAYKYTKDTKILSTLKNWLNYAEQFSGIECPKINKNQKSPYLGDGKAGLLLAKKVVLQLFYDDDSEEIRNINIQIKNLPLNSSNCSLGYGISGIIFLNIITENLEIDKNKTIFTDLLSYRIKQKGIYRYPNDIGTEVSSSFFSGETGVLFLWSYLFYWTKGICE